MISDAAWAALSVGVPATIIAAATLYTSIRNGRKADALIVKSDVIHDLTNSNYTAAINRIDQLEKAFLASSGKEPPRSKTPIP
jgi:hypothetical protein